MFIYEISICLTYFSRSFSNLSKFLENICFVKVWLRGSSRDFAGDHGTENEQFYVFARSVQNIIIDFRGTSSFHMFIIIFQELWFRGSLRNFVGDHVFLDFQILLEHVDSWGKIRETVISFNSIPDFFLKLFFRLTTIF